ncbi:MAG: 4'-phosphopantetheinyl transferase superfamily protein [Desulfovibrio sp.]|jgi:4'-phosphopantetheinyl transferase|nr:4'-phosphopantetheinyl transferase superfamily protein [Desulfovibrio sp.]
MNSLYCTDIRPLHADAALFEACLPAGRAREMRRFRRREDQLHCLSGWLLMARFLGRDGRLDENTIGRGAHGKPYLPGGPHFNLSHSGNFTLLAVCEAPIGVDIEAHVPSDRHILAACFHPAEREYLAHAPTDEQFFDLWALKESYLKMTGIGLFLDPASFCLRKQGWTAYMEEYSDLCFRTYDAIPGYSVAVCAETDRLPEKIVQVVF